MKGALANGASARRGSLGSTEYVEKYWAPFDEIEDEDIDISLEDAKKCIRTRDGATWWLRVRESGQSGVPQDDPLRWAMEPGQKHDKRSCAAKLRLSQCTLKQKKKKRGNAMHNRPARGCPSGKISGGGGAV